MRKWFRGISVLLASMLIIIQFTGCATRASFVYKAGPKIDMAVNLPKKTVAVLPFADQREGGNRNAAMICFIPLVPFGYSKYQMPDGANMFITQGSYNFRPKEDFARAFVQELKVNQVFDDVFYTERESEPNVDYFIRGEIHKTVFTGMLFTYGLSFYGGLLWVVGFPCGRVFNAVDVDIHLVRASDGMLLWSHHIEGERSSVMGYYYNWGSDFDGYPLIIKEGYAAALRSIINEINNGLLE